MKLKYYLKGFGIGIIFATLLLSIAFYAGREEKEPISKQEVERLAAAYGMVYPEETTTEENQSETVRETETTREQGTTRETETTREQGTTRETETTREQGTTRETETIAVGEQGNNQETEISGESGIIQETEEIGETDTAREAEGNVEIEKTITVPFGMYASAIAKLLEDSGVIESAQEFNLYLIRGGYTKRLQAGIYTFVVGMDFDTIAGKLLWESDE